jgi:hypothetical protein
MMFIIMYRSSYGSNNQVHKEGLIQDTTTNPKSRGGLLPSHGGEQCRGVGKGSEAARVNFGSGSSSNLPLVPAASFFLCFRSLPPSVMKMNTRGIYRWFYVKMKRMAMESMTSETQGSRWYATLGAYFISLDAYTNYLTKPTDLAPFRVS